MLRRVHFWGILAIVSGGRMIRTPLPLRSALQQLAVRVRFAFLVPSVTFVSSVLLPFSIASLPGQTYERLQLAQDA